MEVEHVFYFEREAVEGIMQRRTSAALKELSLVELTIRHICKNCRYYTECGKDVLINLPNTIVKKFLHFIESSKTAGRPLLGKEEEFAFIKLLLNGNSTEFNFSTALISFKYEDRLFDHLVSNCPKLKRIRRPDQWVLHNRKRLFSARSADFCRKMCWNDLRVAAFNGYCFGDDLLELISNQAPKLEYFAFAINNQCKFSASGVKSITKMQNLIEIHLDIYSCCGAKTPILILVQIAGRHLSLKKVHFPNLEEPENTAIFIKQISKLFPKKRLLISCASLDQSFDLEWPTALEVEHLTLIGPIKDEVLDRICKIPSKSLRSLVFDGVLPSSIYQIIETLGSTIKTLELKTISHSYDRRVGQTLNLYRILAATKGELQKFEFTVPLRLDSGPLFGITLDHFNELQEFKVEILSGDNSQSPMRKIFEMFLLGSKKMRKLHLQTQELLDVALITLQLDSKCGQDVRELQLEIYLITMVETAVKVASALISCSVFLEKVTFQNLTLDFNLADEIKTRHKNFLDVVQEIGIWFKAIDAHGHDEINTNLIPEIDSNVHDMTSPVISRENSSESMEDESTDCKFCAIILEDSTLSFN